ncbi:MAG: hypothetical protein LBB53_01330, partial [Prevotellaceae bacterium]|nr:hypothetical protein [Prevotellaceae bacterium]
MKKITKLTIFSLAFITVFFCFSTVNAQQLPNSNFESFETGHNGEGQQPTGWKGSNVVQTVAGITARGTLVGYQAGRSGNCVYLHNEEVGAAGITAPAPAFVSLGMPWNEVSGLSASNAIGGCTGGLNFTYRPDTLLLWVKRTFSNTERAHVAVYLWSGNSQGSSYKNKGGSCQNSSRTNEEVDIRGTNSCSTTAQANLIGNGEWVGNAQINNWEQIKVPITYFNNSVPEKINVIISASAYPYSNGDNANSVKAGSKLWADDLSLVYSSKIHELRLNLGGNYRPLQNFDANTLNYTYELGQGSTSVPQIQAFRSGRQLSGSEISITYGEVDGTPTTVTVAAEDGSSTTAYTINFVSAQSTNPRPANILINGTPISGFNAYITNYNVPLPYGTTECPTVTVQKAEAEQTYVISSCTGVPSSVTVRVYAQDISIYETYTINFSIAPLSDNTLQNILIGGAPLAGFSPTTNNYTVELPLGTTQAPAITPVSAYPEGEQTILLSENGLSGTSTIEVYAVASSAHRTYRINFQITASSYAYLNDIKIGGASLPNFNAETLNYNCVLPRGTTVLPAITWVLGEQNQSAALTTGGVNGETRITVTAQNGNIKIYRINFSVERSEISTLNNILIDGAAIPNFHPDTLNYNIELPSGTTALPAITYQLGDYAQTARVITNGLNG